MRMGHVNGRALIADVNDADALPRDVIPDWLNVATLQAENTVHSALFQKAGDPGRTGVFVCV